MAERFWRYDEPAHRLLFGQILAPLITAAGSFEIRQWRDEAYSRAQLHAWMLTFGDVTEPILREAVDRLVARGVTWMPRPGDVKAVCCDLVDERRAVFSARAKKLQDECEHCRDSRGFRENEQGRQVRCDCVAAAAAVMAQAVPSLARPALPASTEAET